MDTDLLRLSHADVEKLLDLDAAAESQRAAFSALWRGAVDTPAKIMHRSRFDDSVVFAYLARIAPDTGAVAKIGSVNPGNATAGLPSVNATVIALDPVTGVPVAMLDGTAVTTVRTAAGSAVAVDALAVADADGLGLIGSGTQARAHARAIARARPLRRVSIWSPSRENRERAAADLSTELGIGVRPVSSAQEAVDGMAIVTTCTISREPVLRGAWLAPGCTVVSVGSFEPDRAEVDAEVIRRAATVVVDDVATAVGHAGPVVTALADGMLAAEDLVPLGAVLAGDRVGRTTASDVVFYNSVGLGVQDAAAAWAVIRAARAGAPR
jgi:ornithine cyclodeaminase